MHPTDAEGNAALEPEALSLMTEKHTVNLGKRKLGEILWDNKSRTLNGKRVTLLLAMRPGDNCERL